MGGGATQHNDLPSIFILPLSKNQWRMPTAQHGDAVVGFEQGIW